MQEGPVIIGAWHIGRIGKHWYQIAEKQFKALKDSGLLAASNHVLVSLAGFNGWSIPQFLHESDRFVLLDGLSLDRDVKPLFSLLQQQAEWNIHRKAKIWFIHGKGATTGTFEPPNAVDYWREYMMYFTVTQWRDNVEALEEYDLCGVEWRPNENGLNGHLSGGFFWMTAHYLGRQCQVIDQYVNVTWQNHCHRCGGPCKPEAVEAHKRSALEFFIGHADPKVCCWHNFNKDLYHFYAYPHLYERVDREV